MAGSAIMLILGFLIAVAVIVFLSNAAPSKKGAGAVVGEDVTVAGSPSTGGAVGTGAEGGEGAAVSVGAGAGALAAQTYAPAASSNKDTLTNGEVLAEGESLTSKNGKYVLTYEYGALVVKSGNFTMWTSPGNMAMGGVFKIMDDGNMGIFPSQYSVTPSGWSSATSGQGTQPYSLTIRDNGKLTLMDSAPNVTWNAPVIMPPVGVDCVMGEFKEWSACSKNCGGGEQTRSRVVITQPNEGGKACGDLVETKPCNTTPCPDCAFSWSPFGQCLNANPTTGVGQKQAQLIVSSPSGPGGLTCPDPNSNVAPCTNCVFSPWSPTGEISAQPCNQTTGLKTQSRTITVPASGGGVCTEPTSRQEACGVDCQLNSWGPWGACLNKSNGVGKNVRTTTVSVQPKNGGKSCTTASGVLSGTQTCDASGNCTEEKVCGDCVQGTVFTYGNCDPATGQKTRTRSGDVAPTNGGNACPSVTDSVSCDVSCEVSGWSTWSGCDNTTGKRVHTRTVTQEKKNNGTACPALTEDENCDVNCEVSDWGQWSACDPTTRQKTRTRTVTRDKKNSGTVCPALTETESCAVQATGDTMNQGEFLAPNTFIKSSNGRYQLNYQGDGSFGYVDKNFGGGWKWGYGNYGETPGKAELGTDGVLRVKDRGGAVRASWGTANTGTGPYKMIMQCDSNLVIYDSTGRATWASGTYDGAACTTAWSETATCKAKDQKATSASQCCSNSVRWSLSNASFICN